MIPSASIAIFYGWPRTVFPHCHGVHPMTQYLRTTALISLVSLTFGEAMADSYTIDPRHTFPSFEVSHIGFSTQRGRFDRTSGKLVLDAKAKTGHVEIVIDTDSIDTGLEELETRLKKEDFFNAAKFPTIQFQGDRFEFAGERPVAVDGTITLLGIAKPLRLAIDHFHCGTHPIAKREVCGANAGGSLKRSDFGMKAFLPAVGDEVKLLIQIEAFKD
jgi:polyisoprenoid-binding protein YceI